MSEFNYSNLRLDEKQNYQVDPTLIKMFLSIVKEGNLQTIIKELDKFPVDVKQIKDQQYDQNVLFYAALIKEDNDAYNVMKYFIDELSVDPLWKDKIQQTVIYYTAREGKFKTTEFLISKGVPLNEKDFYQQTPVYYASREGRLNIVKLLVENGSEVDIEDKFGQTCLFYAIREGHIEVVEYLIDLPNFTKIDKADKKGLTPYLFAIKHGKNAIAELLVSKGVNTQIKTGADKKSKSKKQTKSAEETKVEVEDIQKPKKCLLVKLTENGEKIPLTPSEYEDFKRDYPDIVEMMENPSLLDEMEKNAPEELKNHESWEKIAKKVMNSLWKFKDSEMFHKPVNPIELGIPDYFDIIKRPMDFSTIKKKLFNYQYTNCKEFCEDMDLVFDNCILYNGERSVFGTMCNNVKNEFRKLFDQLNMSIFL